VPSENKFEMCFLASFASVLSYFSIVRPLLGRISFILFLRVAVERLSAKTASTIHCWIYLHSQSVLWWGSSHDDFSDVSSWFSRGRTSKKDGRSAPESCVVACVLAATTASQCVDDRGLAAGVVGGPGGSALTVGSQSVGGLEAAASAGVGHITDAGATVLAARQRATQTRTKVGRQQRWVINK